MKELNYTYYQRHTLCHSNSNTLEVKINGFVEKAVSLKDFYDATHLRGRAIEMIMFRLNKINVSI